MCTSGVEHLPSQRRVGLDLISSAACFLKVVTGREQRIDSYYFTALNSILSLSKHSLPHFDSALFCERTIRDGYRI